MSPVSGFLLVIAMIFIIGIVGELVFEKTGVPDVVWLIVVGILIGPLAGWVSRESLIEIAPYFGALTLVAVLFDGGSQLRLNDLGRAAPRSALLAVLGFIVAVSTIATASMALSWIGWLQNWGWLQAVTLGAIVGGSSSVVIMPALRKAGLSASLSNLISLESALTDVLCVVVTGACIQIHVTHSTDPSQAGLTLAKSFLVGLVVGGVTGVLSLLVLRRLQKSHYAYPLTLAVLLVLFVVIDEMRGSAALGILTAAVIVGNAPSLSKKVGLAETAQLSEDVRDTHGQITFIIKSFFFTFIGAMLAPPWSMIFFGVVLGGLLFASRIPSVFVATLGAGFKAEERGMVAVSMPRGMAAGVLAMMPAAAVAPDGSALPMPGTEQLPIIVFSCVFATILVFAIGFPLLKARMAQATTVATLASDVGAVHLPAGPADQTVLDTPSSSDAAEVGTLPSDGPADITTPD